MKDRIKTMMDYAYFEGKITPSVESKISIASHSIQYGSTCFGGMRGYLREGKARLFRIEDHFERLMNAVKIFGMDFKMTFEEFKKAVSELILANKPATDFYIRPFIYSDDEDLTPKFVGISFKIALYMIPLGDYLDTSRGLRLMVSSWQKFPDASISTKAKAGGSYLNSSLARSEAIRCGYDEALVMDQNWSIVEGSAENFFIVYRGEMIMPSIGSSMLEGITMRTVVEICKEENISIRFEKIDRSMVYTADEILLTGTGAQILFADSVDDRVIGDGKMGEVCQRLRNIYTAIIEKKHPKSKLWISEYEVC
ncbi:MAG: branched-chain amino acid transaminase [Patescibacteria group bacterium]